MTNKENILLMNIILNNTGKRYNREWIFRHLNYEFTAGESYAITGPNGSGKSTLLQVIAGAVLHNEGQVSFLPANKGNQIEEMEKYRFFSFAAPYLDLIEEMTALEFLQFHHSFKPLLNPFEEILEKVGLGHAMSKQIRYYSSGMKQRLKLAQAFFSDTPVLLLDEPTSNLDTAGIDLYNQLIITQAKGKLIMVCSNDEHEFAFCKYRISITDYKNT